MSALSTVRKLRAVATATCWLATLAACDSSPSQPPEPPSIPAPTAQSRCTALGNQSTTTSEGVATITSTQLVAATSDAPEYCRVLGSMPPELLFEVKLPTNWNQHLLSIGGGGFDGAIPQPPGYQLQQNYVTVASNGGHNANGGDESWASNAGKFNDFAYLSAHKALLAARWIVQQRYGQAPVKSYFEGCSNGGREALIQAQRYSDDYDGIIARAPAWNFTWLMVAGNHGMKQFFASAATQLSPAKISTLSNAVLAACDNLDNAQDSVVSNPVACATAFNLNSLRCTGADMDTCLTNAQIATVNAVYSVHALGDGTPYYIGWPAGGESGAGGWGFWRADLNEGLPAFSTRFIRYFLLQDPNYNAMNFVPDSHLPIIRDREALIDADSTNYTAFRQRGGKLILWHGTNDPAISYLSTKLHYEAMVSAAGGQSIADQFVEFFPAPGVEHCFGGAGSDFVDLLAPLRSWAENGTPPSQQSLVTFKLTLQPFSLSNPRPLCKFPRYPRFDGGDPNVATSYSCAL